ncbi:unnamed protein product [Urochloa humidicola]
MSQAESKNDERWDYMQESIDLLFAKVGRVETQQDQMREQLDLNSKVVDQTVRDQIVLAKQLAETGRVVAELRLSRDKGHNLMKNPTVPAHTLPQKGQNVVALSSNAPNILSIRNNAQQSVQVHPNTIVLYTEMLS